MKRSRRQITVGELVNYLKKFPNDLPVFCAPSIVNVDEPEETQEFIYGEKRSCVTIETTAKCAVIGYVG